MKQNRSELALISARNWVKKIGKKEAMKRLVVRGVALSTAYKVCSMKYESTPGTLFAEVLIDEMEKDGISLKNGGR